MSSPQTLYYTFRTNKHISELQKQGLNIFIFGKLKQDLPAFFEKIGNSKPVAIMGIAEIKGSTRIESVAVNKFGKTGKVSKNGASFFKLFIPKDNHFPVSSKGTTSFCNWTMYNVCNFIEQNKLNIEHSFAHYNMADVERVF